MKHSLVLKAIAFAALAAVLLPTRGHSAENIVDVIDLMRTTYKTDRQALVTETLQLTEDESALFWPLYRSYRVDMDRFGDGIVKLVLEYADAYPNVPDERASQLLKDYTALEEKLASKRAWYLRRAAKSLPAAKVLRWVQVENRMDLVLRLQLASIVPLVPTSTTKP